MVSRGGLTSHRLTERPERRCAPAEAPEEDGYNGAWRVCGGLGGRWRVRGGAGNEPGHVGSCTEPMRVSSGTRFGAVFPATECTGLVSQGL